MDWQYPKFGLDLSYQGRQGCNIPKGVGRGGHGSMIGDARDCFLLVAADGRKRQHDEAVQ